MLGYISITRYEMPSYFQCQTVFRGQKTPYREFSPLSMVFLSTQKSSNFSSNKKELQGCIGQSAGEGGYIEKCSKTIATFCGKMKMHQNQSLANVANFSISFRITKIVFHIAKITPHELCISPYIKD